MTVPPLALHLTNKMESGIQFVVLWNLLILNYIFLFFCRSCPWRSKSPQTSPPPSRSGSPACHSQPRPPPRDRRPQIPRCLRPHLLTFPPTASNKGMVSRTQPALLAVPPTWACPARRNTCLTRSPHQAWPRISPCPSPPWNFNKGFASCRSTPHILYLNILDPISLLLFFYRDHTYGGLCWSVALDMFFHEYFTRRPVKLSICPCMSCAV